MENLKDKKVYLLPKGKIQMDFEYIFDDIEIAGYITDMNKGCDHTEGKSCIGDNRSQQFMCDSL